MIHVCLSPSDYWCPEGRRSCLFAHCLFLMRAQDIKMSTFEFGDITTWQSPGRECGGGVWGLPEVPLFWVRGLLQVNEHVLNSSSKTICGKGAPTPQERPHLPQPSRRPSTLSWTVVLLGLPHSMDWCGDMERKEGGVLQAPGESGPVGTAWLTNATQMNSSDIWLEDKLTKKEKDKGKRSN